MQTIDPPLFQNPGESKIWYTCGPTIRIIVLRNVLKDSKELDHNETENHVIL